MLGGCVVSHRLLKINTGVTAGCRGHAKCALCSNWLGLRKLSSCFVRWLTRTQKLCCLAEGCITTAPAKQCTCILPVLAVQQCTKVQPGVLPTCQQGMCSVRTGACRQCQAHRVLTILRRRWRCLQLRGRFRPCRLLGGCGSAAGPQGTGAPTPVGMVTGCADVGVAPAALVCWLMWHPEALAGRSRPLYMLAAIGLLLLSNPPSQLARCHNGFFLLRQQTCAWCAWRVSSIPASML